MFRRTGAYFLRSLPRLTLVVALAASAWARPGSIGDAITTNNKRDLAAEGRLVIELLQNLQYSARQFHEIEGEEIVGRYLKALDGEHLILTKDDVEFLHRRFDRSIKTVYLLKGNLQPAFEIFDYFSERARQRLRWADEQLKPDLKLEEPGNFAHATEPPADAAEADRRWLALLKHSVISEIVAGRDTPAALEEVRKRYRKWAGEIASMDALAVRAQFFDGLIGLFDPHSGYFSAERAHEFQIMMQGAVAGVGLSVRMDDGRCIVQNVSPGGPAEASGEFHVGDELLALSDDEKNWRDLTTLKLESIVASLRGAPGTKIRVAVRTPDGPRREVTLTRAVVVLADGRARGAIVTVPDAAGSLHAVGWIELPDFYASEGEAGGSSAAKDVRELLTAMKARGVQAIVLDLRENPGGAMSEAVALSGLFLPSGKVTLLRGLDGAVTEQAITPAPVAFAGPLVVLTSGRSASASEMFAGAMEFHRRAVVVGEASTFGKGTAQDYIDLNKLPLHTGAKQEWGTLRVTRGRFYFPDGRSPQLRGAPSDIVLPLAGEPGVERESDLPHALPEDTISVPDAKPTVADVALLGADLLKQLRDHAAGRASNLPEYTFIHRFETINAELWKKDASFSVKLSERRRTTEEREVATAKLVGEVRDWSERETFATELIEIEAVQKALDAHAALVRSRKPAGVDAAAGWIQAGIFYRENTAGKLQEVPLSQIHFRRYLADAAEMAAAFSAAAGRPFSREDMDSVLRELSLLEEPTDRQAIDCFGKFAHPANEAERAAVERGALAAFQRLVARQPSLLESWRRLDVARREALRIAVDWVQAIPPPATPAPAPAKP